MQPDDPTEAASVLKRMFDLGAKPERHQGWKSNE